MKRIATIGTWLFVAAALAAVCGCSQDPTKGYTTQSQYVEDVKTVAVPMWLRGKNVYRQGLEMRLTEAIVKRLEMDTPYKVTDKSRADTELRGTIDLIPQRVLSYNPDTGRSREMEVTLTVSFTWTDLRSGKVLAQRRDLRQAATYIPPLSEDFFHGSEDAINRLARRVVEHMEADW
jgi:hypothetical protein